MNRISIAIQYRSWNPLFRSGSCYFHTPARIPGQVLKMTGPNVLSISLRYAPDAGSCYFHTPSRIPGQVLKMTGSHVLSISLHYAPDAGSSYFHTPSRIPGHVLKMTGSYMIPLAMVCGSRLHFWAGECSYSAPSFASFQSPESFQNWWANTSWGRPGCAEGPKGFHNLISTKGASISKSFFSFI